MTNEVRFTIRYRPGSTETQIEGPLDNLDLCYLMLNRARVMLDRTALGLAKPPGVAKVKPIVLPFDGRG